MCSIKLCLHPLETSLCCTIGDIHRNSTSGADTLTSRRDCVRGSPLLAATLIRSARTGRLLCMASNTWDPPHQVLGSRSPACSCPEISGSLLCSHWSLCRPTHISTECPGPRSFRYRNLSPNQMAVPPKMSFCTRWLRCTCLGAKSQRSDISAASR